MATGREARAERLNERLRGAQRTNVGDESFNLDIADFGAAPAPSSSPAKRRKLGSGASAPSPVQDEPRSDTRRSPRTRDPSSLPSTSARSPARAGTATSTYRPESRRDGTNQISTSTMRPPAADAEPESSPLPQRPRLSLPQDEPEPDDLETLPVPSSARPSVRHEGAEAVTDDVIEESPVNAPGSGQRRSARASSALASSTRLQGALQSEENTPMPSSPLTRKSRRSEAATSVRSARSIRQTLSQSPDHNVDELSSDRPQGPDMVDDDIPAGEVSETGEEPAQDELRDDEQATEISEGEAARTIGKKRPRSTQRVSSPQLGSNEREDEQPAKRGRGRPRKSPATQKQGGPKSNSTSQKQPPRPKPTRQPKAKAAPKDGPRKRRNSDEDDAAIELTVQRFVNHRRRGGQDDDDADPLQLDIPFANRTAESAVDVFAQVCDEVIGNTLEQFQEMANSATDTAKKKEFRIKARAVEAYREVLNSRLLQHTVHLNHWHSLRKRVRHVQKEKLELREEIMRLKSEREQVALRMDAVRAKHEADTKESTLLLNTSSTMRDIDMAVAKGQEAPELSSKAQKEAELANLELAVAQVADQASSASSTGGLLSQIRDFNVFLERTAVALESR